MAFDDDEEMTPEEQQKAALALEAKNSIPGLSFPPEANPTAASAPPAQPPEQSQAAMPIAPATIAPSGMSNPAPAPAPSVGSRLASMGGPPKAPVMNPGFAQANEAMRADASPIAKTDDAGNTLPQYKMGVGGRIAHGAASFLRGGIPGLLYNTLSPDAPDYIGRGATNSQYKSDEANRQSRLAANTDKAKSYENEFNTAEKGFQNENTNYADQVRANAAQDVNEIRSKGEADKTTLATKAEQDRTNFQKRETDLKQQLQDANSETSKAAVRSKLGALYNLRGKDLQTYILTNHIPDATKQGMLDVARGHLALERNKADAVATNGMTPSELREHKQKTSAIDEKMKGQVQALALANMGGSDKEKQSANDAIDALQKQKDDIADQIKSRRPAKGGTAKPAGQATPAANPQAQPPRFHSGTTIKFNGQSQKVKEVRRNPSTGEHTYNIGGQWYRDSELK